MLHEWELIRIVTNIVQAGRDQCWLSLTLEHLEWTSDGILELFPCQSRGKKLALVDGFRQITKGIAIAHEIRPHGNDNVHGKLRLFGGRKQEINEGGCLIPFLVHCPVRIRGLVRLLSVAEAKNLLELVHQQQIVSVCLVRRFGNGINETSWTAT